MLEALCMVLGVRVGEAWIANDGNRYKLQEDGPLFVKSQGEWMYCNAYLERILLGLLKPVWIPNNGDPYYYSIIGLEDNPEKQWGLSHWESRDIDRYRLFDLRTAFKTKEEAIERSIELEKRAKTNGGII